MVVYNQKQVVINDDIVESDDGIHRCFCSGVEAVCVRFDDKYTRFQDSEFVVLVFYGDMIGIASERLRSDFWMIINIPRMELWCR